MAEDGKRRVTVRLKHSLPEGAEIHAVLPDTLDEFEAAYAKGELKGLTGKAVAAVLGQPNGLPPNSMGEDTPD